MLNMTNGIVEFLFATFLQPYKKVIAFSLKNYSINSIINIFCLSFYLAATANLFNTLI